MPTHSPLKDDSRPAAASRLSSTETLAEPQPSLTTQIHQPETEFTLSTTRPGPNVGLTGRKRTSGQQTLAHRLLSNAIRWNPRRDDVQGTEPADQSNQTQDTAPQTHDGLYEEQSPLTPASSTPVPVEMGSLSTPSPSLGIAQNDVWERIMKEWEPQLRSIPEAKFDERINFQSLQSQVRALQEAREKRAMVGIFKKLDWCFQRLEHYSSALNVFAQTQPVLCLLWGSLRAVIIVSNLSDLLIPDFGTRLRPVSQQKHKSTLLISYRYHQVTERS